MDRPIALDAGPLGRIAHPRPNREIAERLRIHLDAGSEVLVPEISDCEVRRNLILEGLTESARRLDLLHTVLRYLPITTEAMRLAATLWAEARRKGAPTAGEKALDGDVILAAQARLAGAVVATENTRHLARIADAVHWRDIRV